MTETVTTKAAEVAIDTARFVAAFRDTKNSTAEFIRVVHAARMSGAEPGRIFTDIRDALLREGQLISKSLKIQCTHYATAGRLAAAANLAFDDSDALHAAHSIATGRVPAKDAESAAIDFGTRKVTPNKRTVEFVKLARDLINAAKADKEADDNTDEDDTDEDTETSTPKTSKPVKLDDMLAAVRLFIATSSDDMLAAHIDLVADAIRKGQADRETK